MTHADPTIMPPSQHARTATPERWRDASPPPVLSRLRRRVATAKVPPFEVRLEDGTVHRLAGGSAEVDADTEPRFRLTIRTARGRQALESLDELRLGTAFLQGELDVDGDFLSCLDLRAVLTDRHPVRSLLRFIIPLVVGQRRNDLARVPRHYDFGNEFYFAFLDKRYGLYSQALYTAEDESLEQAVTNKLEYILDVCRLAPGSHILDVGGGWGALERFIGPKGIHSTMLTISREQYKFLSDTCAHHGMPARLRVVRESIFAYDPPERYDAIVLCGVMEHLPDYPRLFARFSRLLNRGGRVYMDFAASRRKFSVATFTHRYVFPGNHTPVFLPGLFEAAAANGFEPIALHNDRHSYFLTLQAWARNLEAAREAVLPIVGEEVYRLFRLYLWGGAHQLQRDGSLESYRVVFQHALGRPSSEIGCYRAV
jgi:cyclopropane-fatty-acyl-phospholipid synthase